MTKKEVVDLGWCMARLDSSNYNITIVAPSDGGNADYPFEPAQCVTIYGINNATALYKALHRLLEGDNETK